MNTKFPTYIKICEETQRILKDIKSVCSRNKEIDEVDELLFYLVGNINLRMNTIFHLLENNITDGVFPLQRTLFELLVAFNAFINATDKTVYVKFFNKKHDFETFNKLNKYFESDNEIIKSIATPSEIELLAHFKNVSLEQIKLENLKVNRPEFKQWYEIASGKSLKELSAEFQELSYYQFYDEPSNWVHPQRLIENMDFETFSQQMPLPLYTFIIGNAFCSTLELLSNIALLVDYYNIKEIEGISEYGEKLLELANQLKLLVGIDN